MRLGLGTVQFGLNYGISNQKGQVPLDEAHAILNYAGLHGIDLLDTAIAYGNSEQRLGEIGVDNWLVVSKLPSVPKNCCDIPKWVENSVDSSLRRLRIKRMYALLLHRPLQLLEHYGDRLYSALQQLKQKGLAEKIGVSIYDPCELDALFQRFRLDIVQAPLNVIDQRLIDSGWLSRLSEQDTELHTRSVFLQGLLILAQNERPKKFDRWLSLWNRWDLWLKDTGLTAVEGCMAFVSSFSEISRIIVGADSVLHLKEILQAAGEKLPHISEQIKNFDQELINPAKW